MISSTQALDDMAMPIFLTSLYLWSQYVAEAADEQSICYGGKEEGLQDRKTLPESVTIAVERR
jgi:hypothetical protein